MPKRQIVTLTTDFGRSDPYLSAMKGVILTGSPHVKIVDISHEIPPHDIVAGGFVLSEASGYFPKRTVHVVVVDPGVGTERRIIAAGFGNQIYLFPDNGIITFVAERLSLEAIAVVQNPRYLPQTEVSRTFHGRDLFAPIACHLLNGLDIEKLGPVPTTFKLLDLPLPKIEASEITGQVIYVDHFGNLISNIPQGLLVKLKGDVKVFCGKREIGSIKPTYGLTEEGELLSLINSMGYVEVAQNKARACDELQAGIGTEIRITV